MGGTNEIKSFNITAEANFQSVVSESKKGAKALNEFEKTANSMNTAGVKSATDKVASAYDNLASRTKQARANIQKNLSQNLPQMTDSQIARMQVDARNKLMSAQNGRLTAVEGSQGYDTFSIKIAEARQQLSMLNAEEERRQGTAPMDLKGAESTIDKLRRIREGVSTGLKGIRNFASKVDGLGTKFLGFGKRVMSALNPMKHFRNEQNRLSLSSTLLGKAFAKVGRMFRLMVTRMLIRGFISNFREGFQHIAQYSEEVNQKFSQIGQSVHTLYNSFASAFTPIIEAIAPVVSQILDWLTSIMNKVGEFMSAITGKSYFIKAKKYNYDYAKSLDNSGKSAKKTSKNLDKTTKSAKKLKKEVSETLGIDNLNIIKAPTPDSTANTINGNGGNGANSGVSAKDMFETKKVSKEMSDLAKKVKKIAQRLFDPLQQAWNKKGARVFKSMKDALGSIWKTIKAIGRDFLKVWQQPATVKIFEDILEIVALIFDTIKAISDQFRKAWNKDNIGLKIFKNIRDVFGIIVKRIKKYAEYTKNWAKNLNFTPLLQSIEKYTSSLKKLFKGISDIVGDFYETVILGISKWVVESGLPNLIQVFTDFNNKVNWDELSKHLHNVWVGVENFAESVGQGLIDFIHWLTDGIADLLNSKWFKDFLNGIGNALKSIKPEHVTATLKTLFTVLVGFKAIKFVSGLFLKIATALGTLKKVIDGLRSARATLSSAKGVIASAGESATAGAGGAVAGGTAIKTLAKGGGQVLAFIATFFGTLEFLYRQETKERDKYIASLEKWDKKAQDIISRTKKRAEDVKKTSSAFSGTNVDAQLNVENAKLYYDELKKITDENGKIKKGYQTQANVLVNKINDALGTNLTIEGKRITGVKEVNKLLGKQFSKTVALQVLERNAEKYYEAKIERQQALNDYIEASNRLEKAQRSGKNYSEAEWEKMYKARNTAHKNYVQALGVEKRYDDLHSAVLSGNNKKIEKSIGLLNKGVGDLGDKYLKWDTFVTNAENSGTKISKALKKAVESGKIDPDTAIKYTNALENAKKKGVKVSKYVGDGIFKNKKSVKTAIDGLNAEVDKLPKKKNTKVEVKNKDKYKEDVEKAKTLVNKMPKKKSTVFDITFNFIGKMAKSLKDILSNIASKIKEFFGFEDKNTKKKKKKVNGGIGSFAKGGFVNTGDFFLANERGAELIGTVGGKTAVSSNMEITGIREAVEEQGNQQNLLLQRQNNLLMQLLQKSTDVILDGKKMNKELNRINNNMGSTMVTT